MKLGNFAGGPKEFGGGGKEKKKGGGDYTENDMCLPTTVTILPNCL